MVEPVVLLLNGRGHPIVRAREAGIEAEDDQTLVEYALARGLVIITFESSLYYVRGAIPGRYQRLLLTVVVEWENDRTGCVKTSYVTDDPLMRGTVEWVREKR